MWQKKIPQNLFSDNLQNDLNSVTDYGINELFYLCW